MEGNKAGDLVVGGERGFDCLAKTTVATIDNKELQKLTKFRNQNYFFTFIIFHYSNCFSFFHLYFPQFFAKVNYDEM